jgi:hypothetical protein
MSACCRTVALWTLVLSTGCAAGTDDPPCDAAISQQLELVRAAAARLHELAGELSTTLFGSCLALSLDPAAGQATAPPDVDTMVAVCGRAAQSLVESRTNGAEVAGTPAQCSAPAPDQGCLERCSNDSGCTSLCTSLAAFEVECSGAQVSVRGGERRNYEEVLPPVLLTYACSRVISVASSNYVDVALPLLTEHEVCLGSLAPEHWDDVIMLQAVLVMSSDIAEQVMGFPL